jgi:hypothetical protein
VMGVSSGSDEPAYPTLSLSTPPHSFHPHPLVTPTLAQVNSFNFEYNSGTSDIHAVQQCVMQRLFAALYRRNLVG